MKQALRTIAAVLLALLSVSCEAKLDANSTHRMALSATGVLRLTPIDGPLSIGQTVEVTWTIEGEKGEDQLILEAGDTAGDFQTLLLGIPSALGVHAWTVNAPPGVATLRLRSEDGKLTAAVPLSIRAASLTVTPLAVDEPRGGSIVPLTWSTDSLGGEVTIVLLGPDGTTSVLAESTTNDGKESVTLPPGVNGTPFQIIIRSALVPSIQSKTPPFSITDSAPAVTFSGRVAAGDPVSIGSSLPITWDTNGSPAEVKIDVSLDGGSSWVPIVQTLNDGAYDWTVVSAGSSNALIRIVAADDGAVLSVSPSFTIPASGLGVTTPATPGVVYDAGASIPITWSVGQIAGTVDLLLSLDGGTTWTTILGGTVNDGAQSITLPADTSDNAVFGVAATNAPLATLTRSETFAISAPRSVVVTSPNTAVSWQLGSDHAITWSTSGTIASVSIEYSGDGGTTWSTVSPGTTNNGSFVWTVDRAATAFGRIRIRDASTPAIGDTSDSDFAIPTPSFIVTYPSGTGVILERGASVTVLWTSGGNSGNVAIDLSLNNGTDWQVLNASTADDGAQAVTLPSGLTADGRIRVRSVHLASVFDVSNNAFTVELTPSVTVTSPSAAGSLFNIGSSQAITWTSTGVIASVKIEYYDGSAWSSIVASTPNDGSYSWTVDRAATTSALVRVSDATNAATIDASDNAFTIRPPTLTVTAPVSGQIVDEGTSATVTWTSGNLSDTVDIDYSANGGSSWTNLVDDSANDSTQSVTIPAGTTATGRIRIKSSTLASVHADSADFTVSAPRSLTVTAPNGAESWPLGSDQAITWSSTGTIGFVSIDYSGDGGTTWATVSASTANDGTFTWAVDRATTAAGRIRIRDASTPAIGDTSNANFSIPAASFTVTYPTAASIAFAPNASVTVLWTSGGNAGNVGIDLSLNNGTDWQVLSASTADDGTQAVTLPSDLTTTGLIRVRSVHLASVFDVSNNAFTVEVTKSVTVTSPSAAGSLFNIGSAQAITWTSTGVIANVKIEYYDGSAWSSIVASTPNDGSYTWTVDRAATTTALVRVSDATNAATIDASDNAFTIRTPTLTVTAPVTGQIIDESTSTTVTWTSGNLSDTVDIDYSANGGSSWTNLANDTADDGTQSVTIPAGTTVTGRIRVKSSTLASVLDDSDDFVVSAARTLTVTAPNGAESWDLGSSRSVTWTKTGTIANVKIEYSGDNGSTWSTLLASTAAAGGTYTWTVDKASTNQGLIRLTDAAYASIVDSSNAVFSIPTATITVVSPNGGESYTASTSQTVTWSSSNVSASGTVNILISTDNGTSYSSLVAGTANDGTQAATMPATVSATCLIKVESAQLAAVSDVSGAAFAITSAAVLGAATSFPNATTNGYAYTTISAGRSGQAILAYQHSSGAILSSFYDGSAWAATETLDSSVSGNFSGSIAFTDSASDKVAAVYHKQDPGFFWEAGATKVNGNPTGTGNWGAVGYHSQANATTYVPWVVGSDGEAIATWVNESTSPHSLYASHYNGTSWGADVRLDASGVGGVPYHPLSTVAAAELSSADPRFAVMWAGNSPTRLFLRIFSGGAWGSIIDVDASATDVPYFAFDIDAAGRMAVVYADQETPTAIYFGYYNGTTWTTQREVIKASSGWNDTPLGLALSPDGTKVIVVWNETVGADLKSRVGTVSSGTVTWSAIQDVEALAGDTKLSPSQRAVDINNAGSAVVAFSHSNSQRPYYNVYNWSGGAWLGAALLGSTTLTEEPTVQYDSISANGKAFISWRDYDGSSATQATVRIYSP